MDELLSHSISNLDSGYNFLKDSLQKQFRQRGENGLLQLVGTDISKSIHHGSLQFNRKWKVGGERMDKIQ